MSAGYSTIATLTMIDRLYRPTKHLGNRGGCQNLSYSRFQCWMGFQIELLRHRPGLGTLAGQAAAPRAQLSMQGVPAAPGASALSAAELRLLLPHLTLTQVVAELFLSAHTVRTQAKSIYQKLGAPTRRHAVARARQLGLLDG